MVEKEVFISIDPDKSVSFPDDTATGVYGQGLLSPQIWIENWAQLLPPLPGPSLSCPSLSSLSLTISL